MKNTGVGMPLERFWWIYTELCGQWRVFDR